MHRIMRAIMPHTRVQEKSSSPCSLLRIRRGLACRPIYLSSLCSRYFPSVPQSFRPTGLQPSNPTPIRLLRLCVLHNNGTRRPPYVASPSPSRQLTLSVRFTFHASRGFLVHFIDRLARSRREEFHFHFALEEEEEEEAKKESELILQRRRRR